MPTRMSAPHKKCILPHPFANARKNGAPGCCAVFGAGPQGSAADAACADRNVRATQEMHPAPPFRKSAKEWGFVVLSQLISQVSVASRRGTLRQAQGRLWGTRRKNGAPGGEQIQSDEDMERGRGRPRRNDPPLTRLADRNVRATQEVHSAPPFRKKRERVGHPAPAIPISWHGRKLAPKGRATRQCRYQLALLRVSFSLVTTATAAG